eukprot:COSAG01_NODE_3430_length_6105_cov_6.934565_6_plen_85_part_00
MNTKTGAVLFNSSQLIPGEATAAASLLSHRDEAAVAPLRAGVRTTQWEMYREAATGGTGCGRNRTSRTIHLRVIVIVLRTLDWL